MWCRSASRWSAVMGTVATLALWSAGLHAAAQDGVEKAGEGNDQAREVRGPAGTLDAPRVADSSVRLERRPELRPADPQEHALDPILRYALAGQARINNDIRDYTCRLAKRERVEGRLLGYEFMELKIRHRQERDGQLVTPFSVYVKFLGPKTMAGREVLWVENQNGGDLIARRGGRRSPNMTLQIDPVSPLAMNGNRYPISEIGVQNLVRRVVEVVENDKDYPECHVEIFRNAKLNGQACTHVQVVHPEKREHFRYHKASVFVSDELMVPVYFASYDWPGREDQEPPLLEEYAYSDFKVNVGLTDSDFQPDNPAYQFDLKNLSDAPPTADELSGEADRSCAKP